MSYETLHRQCRTLEAQFDSKLTSYSRLASNISRHNNDVEAEGSIETWRTLEQDLEELLIKLQDTNEQLAALSNVAETPLSQSMMRSIQRHRDVLQDQSREFRRTKTNVQLALDQANLLTGVRNDIDAYKSSAADALLAERGRIDSSHRMTDDVIQQAYETRAEFNSQRTSLAGINTRMTGVINTMPGINNLLSMIKTRRRRDAIILGLVIGICFILFFTYMWR